jgi:hypothetical protein
MDQTRSTLRHDGSNDCTTLLRRLKKHIEDLRAAGRPDHAAMIEQTIEMLQGA